MCKGNQQHFARLPWQSYCTDRWAFMFGPLTLRYTAGVGAVQGPERSHKEHAEVKV
jgi:hypothetical protein